MAARKTGKGILKQGMIFCVVGVMALGMIACTGGKSKGDGGVSQVIWNGGKRLHFMRRFPRFLF